MYKEKIREMIEPVIEGEGFELVDLECQRGKVRWLVRIYIDCERGVTIDDCASVSGEIGEVLSVYDVPPGPYDLEVSSPGLDRPLARDKDFLKYRGETVKIRTKEALEGRKNFRGRLVDYVDAEGEKTIIMEVDGKIYRIPRMFVAKANLQYDLEGGGKH
ncbi:MAG: ribosome maturation factor RimP [Syntrophales bacterium]|jgi:ribosome maturation factor RimP|nr:ribosome maturation factor RimP [Syntrophales bacterium]MDY0043329.1 ribosome maturation factor RimP [Syntrophales bacterium]